MGSWINSTFSVDYAKGYAPDLFYDIFWIGGNRCMACMRLARNFFFVAGIFVSDTAGYVEDTLALCSSVEVQVVIVMVTATE